MMNQNLSNLTEHPQNTGLVKSPPNNTENLQKDTLGQGLSLQEFIAECQERTYTLTTEQLNELVTCLNSENLYRQYFGVIGIRKLLATPSPPIQPLIDAGIIPRLVEFLGKEDEHQLQAEAAWTFGNLCSGTTEQTQQIVENGAIPALIMLLRSPNHDVKLKAIWPLGNLAGDSVDSRDEILEGGAVSPLIEILEKAIFEGDKLMIRDANWVLANLCRGKPLPLFEEIKEAIPLFAKVIMSQEDPGILIEAVWCLFYFSDEGEKGEERVQQVIDTGVVPYMVKHMDHSHLPVLIGCLRTIGNILLGDDEQVDIPGVMEKLFSALNHKKEAVRKYAAMAISNFTSGTSDHLEYIVGNPEYLDQLLNVGINDIQEIRKEIAVVLNDIIDKANKEQMRILLEENKKKLFAFFRKLLVEKEVSLQKIALAGIWMIWDLKAERAPEGFTKASCWALWEKNKILTALKELQGSSSPSIKELVAKILGAGAVEKQ